MRKISRRTRPIAGLLLVHNNMYIMYSYIILYLYVTCLRNLATIRQLNINQYFSQKQIIIIFFVIRNNNFLYIHCTNNIFFNFFYPNFCVVQISSDNLGSTVLYLQYNNNKIYYRCKYLSLNVIIRYSTV